MACIYDACVDGQDIHDKRTHKSHKTVITSIDVVGLSAANSLRQFSHSPKPPSGLWRGE